MIQSTRLPRVRRAPRRRISCIRPTLAAALGVLFAIGPAAWADVRTEAVEYREGDLLLEGVLAFDDAGRGRRPAVIVVHEWWGLGDHPKRSARRLAELGYVAFALDMYGKGKLTDDPAQAGKWAGEVRGNPATLKRRFEAALATLRADPRVDPDRVAAIGYCFGGTVCLEAARMGLDLRGVVSFHGGLASRVENGDATPEAAILVCHGGADPHAPPAEAAAFMEEMNRRRADWRLEAYGGAVHSFTNPAADKRGMKGVGYHKEADRLSWQAMKAFLRENLQD